jgi:hypothetical protein
MAAITSALPEDYVPKLLAVGVRERIYIPTTRLPQILWTSKGILLFRSLLCGFANRLYFSCLIREQT